MRDIETFLWIFYLCDFNGVLDQNSLESFGTVCSCRHAFVEPFENAGYDNHDGRADFAQYVRQVLRIVSKVNGNSA